MQLRGSYELKHRCIFDINWHTEGDIRNDMQVSKHASNVSSGKECIVSQGRRKKYQPKTQRRDGVFVTNCPETTITLCPPIYQDVLCSEFWFYSAIKCTEFSAIPYSVCMLDIFGWILTSWCVNITGSEGRERRENQKFPRLFWWHMVRVLNAQLVSLA